jgi:hypothetical protein
MSFRGELGHDVLVHNHARVYRLRPARSELVVDLVAAPAAIAVTAGALVLLGMAPDKAVGSLTSLIMVILLRTALRFFTAQRVELHEERLVVSDHGGTREIPAGTLRSVRINRLTRLAVFTGPGGRFRADATTVRLIEPDDPGSDGPGAGHPSYGFLDLTRDIWDLNHGLRPANRFTGKLLRRHGVELIPLSSQASP